ncbi:MFS transporter [uncultured Corynebacterium sp.]|uniref:MFS transporter n=1 Tax=uncultured Corynebacterium sp. TaxID=159447 RepID=UPI00259593CF|nr:MFS transporter [uncultured Corynebacterium sp.]
MASISLSRQPALSTAELEQITSVWKAPGLFATLISVFCAFGGWTLLLPVIPLTVIQHGGSESLAGLSTGVFMGATVLTQAFTPWLIRVVGYPAVMAGAGIMLGLPALVYLVDMSPPVLLGIAVLRGMGFGAVTVAESALIAELVPRRLMGNSSAALGTAVGVAQLISFPLGLWLLNSHGQAWVFSVAAIYAVVGSAAAWWIPYQSKARKADQDALLADATAARSADNLEVSAAPIPAATWKLAAVPGLAIGAIATGFAAFSTFLAPAVEAIDLTVAALISAAGLSVLGGMQMLGRIIAGRYTMKRGEAGHLAGIGLGCGITGLILAGILIALAPVGIPLVAGAFAAAGIFGLGFGLVQNEALLMLFERLPNEKTTLASALWNMTFDSGTGIGAILLGIAASAFAFQQAFWIAACIGTFALCVVIADRVVGRRRLRGTAKPAPAAG